MLKAIYSIFKLSSARREDYLKINELWESHESKSVAYLFSKNFCGQRWLVNGSYIPTLKDISLI